MHNLLGQLKQKLRKPILFGFCGAGGCLLAATTLGEVFLDLTQRPPIIERNSQAVLLLIDTSGSMDDDNKLAEVKQAAKDFVARQDLTQDSFAVVGFGSEVQIGTGLTSDLMTLNQAIDRLADGGGTRMDLGIENAIEELQSPTNQSLNQTNQTVDRHILLFTDGQPAPHPPAEQVDVMFVLDITGSMREEIDGVQQGIQGFADELKLRKLDGQVGLIAFGDRSLGEEPQLLTFDGTVFTADSDRFKTQVSKLREVYGGDDPESSLDALALAARQPFREGAIKVILLITDALPKIPDREISSLKAAVRVLRDNQIDQLHLVIQESDRPTYEPLQDSAPGEVFLISETAVGRGGFESVLPILGQTIAETTLAPAEREPIVRATLSQAESAKSQKVNIIAVGTGDADTSFLSQLTGSPDRVFYVNTGDFNTAFQAAEKVIYEPLLIEADQTAEEGALYTLLRQFIEPEKLKNYSILYSVLRIGSWTAILAIGTSLALIVGQNLYQRRRLLSLGETAAGTMGGLAAGITAGTLGQLVYSSIPTLATGGQILGWTVLGTLLGGGMSFFVPNLKKHRGILGGCLGGLLGGVGFVLITGSSSAIAGRIAGSAIIGFGIGVMIALLELLSREARLLVHWTPTEQREFLLGSRPVVLGSSSTADIYLSKHQGYFPITAKIFKEGEMIVMQYDPEYGQAKGMKKIRHELNNGARRKFGQLTLEIQSSQS